LEFQNLGIAGRRVGDGAAPVHIQAVLQQSGCQRARHPAPRPINMRAMAGPALKALTRVHIPPPRRLRPSPGLWTGVTPSRRAGDAGERSYGVVRVTRMDHSTRRRLHRAAMQVGLDQELRAAAETNAVDLKIFQHALDVVARFGEGDALDPAHRIDLLLA